MRLTSKIRQSVFVIFLVLLALLGANYLARWHWFGNYDGPVALLVVFLAALFYQFFGPTPEEIDEARNVKKSGRLPLIVSRPVKLLAILIPATVCIAALADLIGQCGWFGSYYGEIMALGILILFFAFSFLKTRGAGNGEHPS